MSVHLLIHDGSPWWESPDIWVVPGNDPNGPPGSPIAGLPAYMWARVSNVGNVLAQGCRIDFYWANPSAQMVVGVAMFVGSAYADLDPGETQDVLCLVPWIPVIVNGGHECVLAVVHGAGDTSPIPDPLPNGYPFDPPSHDQIAQLNLSVLEAAMLHMPQTLFVNAIRREAKDTVVAIEFGQEVDERVLANLGVRDLRPAPGQHVAASLSLEARCHEQHDEHGARELKVHVPRGGIVPVFVSLHGRDLPHGHYQLVRVVERSDGKLMGGVSYLIANTHKHGNAAATQKPQP